MTTVYSSFQLRL